MMTNSEQRPRAHLEGLVIWLLFLLTVLFFLLRLFDALLYSNESMFMLRWITWYQIESATYYYFVLFCTFVFVPLPFWVHFIHLAKMIRKSLYANIIAQKTSQSKSWLSSKTTVLLRGVTKNWIFVWLCGLSLLVLLLAANQVIRVGEQKLGAADFLVTEFRKDLRELSFFANERIPGLLLFPSKENQNLIAQLKNLNMNFIASRRIIKTEGVNFPTRQDEDVASNILTEKDSVFAIFWGQISAGEASVWITYKAYNDIAETPNQEFPMDVIKFNTTDIDSAFAQIEPCLKVFEHMRRYKEILEDPNVIGTKEEQEKEIRRLINELEQISREGGDKCADGLRVGLIGKYEYLLFRSDPKNNKEYLASSHEKITQFRKETNSKRGSYSEAILLAELKRFDEAIDNFEVYTNDRHWWQSQTGYGVVLGQCFS